MNTGNEITKWQGHEKIEYLFIKFWRKQLVK